MFELLIGCQGALSLNGADDELYRERPPQPAAPPFRPPLLLQQQQFPVAAASRVSARDDDVPRRGRYESQQRPLGSVECVTCRRFPPDKV
ncbi:unnamed protein product [Haemonchus placei]|uniref:Uncharacterized protein n=1 Tax=Haemonchus placei TaxID=6290 RepID=A0A0N4VYG7_HAEPC|nr:unnamed protein product [Haemonchus placei]